MKQEYDQMNKVAGIMYHEDLDGATGAAVVLSYLDEQEDVWDVNLYGIQDYNQELPSVDMFKAVGVTHLYVVDFCPSEAYLQRLVDHNVRVQVFDHHEQNAGVTRMFGTYNKDQSGCGIAWRQLFAKSDKPMPYPVRCVEDRDLWKFEVAGTKQVCAFLHTLLPDPMKLRAWVLSWDEDVWNKMRELGNAIVQAQQGLCAQMYQHAFFGKLCGKDAVYVNTSAYRSELGALVYTQNPDHIAVIYWMIDDNTVKVSLRCADHIRVDQIARKFGGGGHKHASSFFIDANQFFAQLRKPQGLTPT